MFVIYGRKTARIKKHTGTHESCKNCKSFDLDIRVYRKYFHLFFLPVFPFGDKTVQIRCNTCGERLWNITLQRHYEGITKTPFYLYAGIILFSALMLLLVIVNLNAQNEKAKYVDHPREGDVYLVRKDTKDLTSYYFLRLSRISGDTVFAYHNNWEYNGFVTSFNEDDYFHKEEEWVFSKRVLKQMLDKNEINTVNRDYGDAEGFNRVK